MNGAKGKEGMGVRLGRLLRAVVTAGFVVVFLAGPVWAGGTLQARAERGDAAAQLQLGRNMLEGRDATQKNVAAGAEWIRKAAEQGNAGAQHALGVLYAEGRGVAQSYPQAAVWFRRAAEQGEPAAENSLGLMYAKGQGVPQNFDQAVAWYRDSARQGNAMAQYNLGVMYEFGIGLGHDLVLAYVCYNIAAAADYPPAAAGRDRLLPKLTPDQVKEAQKLSTAWAPGQTFPAGPAAHPVRPSKVGASTGPATSE